MKKRIIASLLIGMSFTLAATTSHGKTSHAAAKKHALIAAKHSKKSASNGSKRGKKLTRVSKKHTSRKLARHSHSARRHTQQASALIDETSIPQLADQEPLDLGNYDGSLEHTLLPPASHRIHKIIMVGNKLSLIEQPAEQQDEEAATGHYQSAHGVITTSLADAGEEIGLSEDLIQQLTDIFAWDIDFATSLHQGDQFTVVYENKLNSDPVIVAAEFVNQGRIFTAVKYQDPLGNDNYYTPEGKAMRKAFLSTPVEFARISSHFNINRRHPILNRIRAHKGVDYAARTGTPVKSTGDGIIAFLGHKGGYGQVVIIKHGDRYETLYAHLSRFKRDLLEGDNVKQGQIIGYVGQTGLATGPHLHYEFRVDGIHKNPELLQASRNAFTLNGRRLAEFKDHAQPLLAELYHTKAKTLLARNQTRME